MKTKRRTPRNVSVSTTVVELIKNNPERTSFILENIGTTDCKIDIVNSLTGTNGLSINAGAKQNYLVSEDGELVTSQWFCITASGTTTLRVWEIVKVVEVESN